MSDIIKNTEDQKYPSASHMEELGSATAEAICSSMVAANDDAPSFGPAKLGPSLTISGLTSNSHLETDHLASALSQLKSLSFPAPFFKGKFRENFKVILGKKDKK